MKISDQGGGIAHDKLSKIWEYGFSTAKFPNYGEKNQQPLMHGYGLGLPLARIYARYFGGDLEVNSMDGYGTDIYLKLNRIKENRIKENQESNTINVKKKVFSASKNRL